MSFPPGLHDRGRDAWEALLAIGDTAGSYWSGRGRAWKACEHVTASTADEETGAREMLLADLRTIFEAEGWPEAIPSSTTLDKLTELEGRPWSEWKRGKVLTARGLSSLLKPFGVQSRNRLFPNGRQAKAYFLADLEAHWRRISPQQGIRIRPPAAKLGHFLRSVSVHRRSGVDGYGSYETPTSAAIRGRGCGDPPIAKCIEGGRTPCARHFILQINRYLDR